MKKLLSLLFLLLPVASFAEETADDMTTIFEEHFDGWLYPHESGMNATYEYKKRVCNRIQFKPCQMMFHV